MVVNQLTTMGSTALYRWFDKDNQLLYVGISSNVARRAIEHEESKDWWSSVRYCYVKHYESREEALRKEAHLIRTLAPIYNVQHNGGSAYLSPSERRRTQKAKHREEKARQLKTKIEALRKDLEMTELRAYINPGRGYEEHLSRLRRALSRREERLASFDT